MFDDPHKTGPDALEELNQLSLETRRHLHGLFERHVEGLIILVFQAITFIALLDSLPDSKWQYAFLFTYIAFSIFWALRSLRPVMSTLIAGFSKEELRKARTYERYCMGGWFLKTVGMLLLATVVLCILLYIT